MIHWSQLVKLYQKKLVKIKETKMFIKTETHTLVAGKIEGIAPTHRLAAGQVHAYSNDDLTPADYATLGDRLDLGDYARRMNAGLEQVKSAFVGMDQIIDGIGLALTSGEDLFMISPPGTAKTTIARTIAQIASADFASVLFHSELSYSEMVGGFDPEKAMEGKIERKLDRIGSAHIALLDEIWKAGAGVSNMLLDVLEGKQVEDRPIPLLSTISASNELPEDRASMAMWDRLLIRFHVDELDGDDFESMLTASAGSTVIDAHLTADEIRLASAVAELMALHIDSGFARAVRDLRESALADGISASNRRWRKIVKAAAARAILDGEELDQHHLIVAQDILWNDPDEIKAVRKVVRATCDPLANAIFNIQALYEAFQEAFDNHDLKTTDMAAVQSLLSKAEMVQDEIDKAKPHAKNGNQETLTTIEVELTVLKKMVRRGR